MEHSAATCRFGVSLVHTTAQEFLYQPLPVYASVTVAECSLWPARSWITAKEGRKNSSLGYHGDKTALGRTIYVLVVASLKKRGTKA